MALVQVCVCVQIEQRLNIHEINSNVCLYKFSQDWTYTTWVQMYVCTNWANIAHSMIQIPMYDCTNWAKIEH